MPENKKYLDLQGLGKYHEKAMGIIDKKINWDNLKNKPFGTQSITTTTLVKGTVAKAED